MREIRIPVNRENDLQLDRAMQEHGLRYTESELIATFLDDLKAGEPAVLEYLNRTGIRSNSPERILQEDEQEIVSVMFDLYGKESVKANEEADKLLYGLYSLYEKRCTDMFLCPDSLPMFLDELQAIHTEKTWKKVRSSIEMLHKQGKELSPTVQAGE